MLQVACLCITFYSKNLGGSNIYQDKGVFFSYFKPRPFPQTFTIGNILMLTQYRELLLTLSYLLLVFHSLTVLLDDSEVSGGSLMQCLVSFPPLGPGALKISASRTQFWCIALHFSLLSPKPRYLPSASPCHPQNSIPSCIKQEHIRILVTQHSNQDFMKEDK